MMNVKDFKLGDAISKALAALGVTEDRVNEALGRPCGCKARREMLNRLNPWAERVNEGRVEDARKYLEEIIGVDGEKSASPGTTTADA